jgi:starch synthase (maltosyl-transferring)
MTGRIPILDVSPVVSCGRYPAKSVVGESFVVSATAFGAGQEAIGVEVVLTDPGGRSRPPALMRAVGDDRWAATVSADSVGLWGYSVRAWVDTYASWRHVAEIDIPAGVDVALLLAEGAAELGRIAAALPARPSAVPQQVARAAAAVADTSRPPAERLATALDPELLGLLARHPLRDRLSIDGPFPLLVERERALVGSWYELFPRSEGAEYDPVTASWRSGSFRSAAHRLDAVADLGFDVVYLPPVHPIGRVNRKGPNNSLVCRPGDPGSPWAIGAEEGGHDALHPDLGTWADFDAFVAHAAEVGLEVAMDLALQCAPDHPWVAAHPEWFTTRADGTIAYAENPPKKYQDIYPLNFDNDPEGLYAEVLRVLRVWMGHGVRIFRVDNPHTKPVSFWERLLAEVRDNDPDVIFLSEAFTRPPVMQTLAKAGFQQSYTHFTWQHTKPELERFLTDTSHATSHFLRPNFFVNTPDIVTAYLQHGGFPAYKVRAVLAATAAPSWGVYAGYELGEHEPVEPGSEEYLDSEKYQYKPRDWAGAESSGRSIAPYLRRLNEIRRSHPALRRLRNLALHHVPDADVVAYSKREPAPDGGEDTVLVVVNLDPHRVRESMVELDMPALGMQWTDSFVVQEELTGQVWRWGQRNYVRLDPAREPAHVLAVRRNP